MKHVTAICAHMCAQARSKTQPETSLLDPACPFGPPRGVRRSFLAGPYPRSRRGSSKGARGRWQPDVVACQVATGRCPRHPPPPPRPGPFDVPHPRCRAPRASASRPFRTLAWRICTPPTLPVAVAGGGCCTLGSGRAGDSKEARTARATVRRHASSSSSSSRAPSCPIPIRASRRF